MAFPKYSHDPEAVIQYGWNWSPYCGERTITASTWDVPTGITAGDDDFSNSMTFDDGTTGPGTGIWLGPVDTATVAVGSQLTITNHVTLSDGTEDDRSFVLKITEK